MAVDWLIFIAASVVIIAAGSVLAICAEVIVRRTDLGALWFGAVVVALVTSLPELVTSVAAVRRDASELALGNLFGSNMANMAILAAITIAFTTRRLLQRAALENVLTAMLSMGLTALALVLMTADSLPSIGDVGLGPLIIGCAFFIGTFAIKEQQQGANIESTNSDIATELSLKAAQAGFVVAAIVIVAAGPQLAASADELADSTGVGETFFGSFLLAMVTSLPELSVSIAALRIGAQNLAIANLLGSNAMNMALLLPLDFAASDHQILDAAGPGLLTTAGFSVLLMSIGTMAIVLRAERNRLPVDMAAVLMLGVYVIGLWAIYKAG